MFGEEKGMQVYQSVHMQISMLNTVNTFNSNKISSDSTQTAMRFFLKRLDKR